jgi:hypothetical protein
MAAQLAGMRNGLIALGFSAAAATEITEVQRQGYDSLLALSELDDDTISDLISTVRKPGGTIPNPAVPPVPADIPNPGINVGHRAIINLKLACFVTRHYVRTSRPLDNPVGLLAPNNIRRFVGLKNAENSYSDTDALPALERIEKIREHIENIDAHLLKTLGMARSPLAYVVRDDVVVPPSAQDPSTDYATVQEEMVARMPHTHLAYREDNIKVWEILRDSLHETEAFHWIKGSERRRDGRSAYAALTTHYLGASKNEALRNQADTRLMKTFYGGEKNKFDWSKYVSVHKKCHNDLEATGPPLSEDDKVRRLLNGINTQKLDVAVLFVRSSPALMSNFDAAVDSISTVVENIRESFKRPFQQISSAETGPPSEHGGRGRRGRGQHGGRGGRGGRGRGGRGRGPQGEPWTEPITARWYQQHELARMSDNQRHEMRSARNARDDRGRTPEQDRQVAMAGTQGSVATYPPGYPPPPPPYPPPFVHPPPPPSIHIASVANNRQNPALQGPRGHAPTGYPASVTGSYASAPQHPGYPHYY